MTSTAETQRRKIIKRILHIKNNPLCSKNSEYFDGLLRQIRLSDDIREINHLSSITESWGRVLVI